MRNHGNKGNRNAAKAAKDKLPEHIHFTAPEGTKARIRMASVGTIAAWCRDAVAEKLDRNESPTRSD